MVKGVPKRSLTDFTEDMGGVHQVRNNDLHITRLWIGPVHQWWPRPYLLVPADLKSAIPPLVMVWD